MFTDAFGKIWYKGNLHTHTTNSDGAYTPEETIALYKSKGYDFLALTDHWFRGEGRQEENFLLLNGTEFDVGSTVQEGIYHIVGIGMEKAPALTKRAPGISAQKIIDEIHNVNGIAILAHPAWSLDRASEVAKLYGIDGCEIYNTTSGLPWNCRPYSGVFFDRFILGKWVAAEGAIYPQFAACPEAFEIEKENIPPLKYINIGVDFGGNKSNHAFVASGVTKDFDKLYVLKSESICAKGVSVAGMIGAFMRFVSDVEQKFGKADFVYADSAEQAIINEMRQKTDYSILNSIKNSIVNRIRCTDLLLSNKRIFLCKGENDALVSGLSDALWDEKSGMQDRRLDNGTTDIDILDAFEYSFEAFIKELLEG